MEGRIRLYGLLVVFALGISFPLLNAWFQLVPDISSFENRKLASKPELDLAHLDPFPEKYTAYYNDTFNLRNRLVRAFNYFSIQVFRQSPVKTVILGKDKWLFLSGEELDSYVGRNSLTEKELHTIADELCYRARYLAARGTRFYFMVVPCKISVYSEKVGYEYFRINKRTWGEQLNQYLSSYKELNVINLFDSLRFHRQPDNLYYKLDNHWNDLGAFYAAQQVVLKMKNDFASLAPLKLEDFKLERTVTTNGNINKMFGYLDMFKDDQITLKPLRGFKSEDAELSNYPPPPHFLYAWDYEKVKRMNGAKLPRLLIISDSFGGAIFPFLAESYSKTVKIWDAWQYKLNEEIVENEKPDAVLLMIDEPILHSLLSSKNFSNPQLRSRGDTIIDPNP